MSDPPDSGAGMNDDGQGSDNGRPTKNRPGSKPRASRAGTRSVSTLTSEQLARKRANDREAQRAIRQRTREHIERLEKRINELSELDDSVSGSYPALEEVQRRNVELEQELKILRETVLAGEDGTNSPDVMYLNSGEYPWPHGGSLPPSNYATTSNGMTHQNSSWPPHASTYESHTGRDQYLNSGYVGPSNTTAPGYRPSQLTVSTNHVTGVRQNQIHTLPMVPVRNTAAQNSPFRERPGTGPLQPLGTQPVGTYRGPEPRQVVLPSNAANVPSYMAFVNRPSIYHWDASLHASQPASVTERVVLGALQERRGLLAQGVTGVTLFGPRHPSLNAFLYPDQIESEHPLIIVLTQLIRAIPFLGFPERIGTLILVYPVYQWLIQHTSETFSALPEFYIPRESQLTVPHPIWIAMIGWPRLREAIITNQEKYATPDFEYLFSINVNVNWPHSPQEALQRVGNDWKVTERFFSHVYNLDNWSINEPFQRRYPELRDTCRFT